MTTKTVLERFKEIEELEVADEQGLTVKDILPYFCENVEQALLNAQKEHNVLEFIKKNMLDIESFNTTFVENAYNYNFYEISYGTYGKGKLTEEEFNLLKEVLE